VILAVFAAGLQVYDLRWLQQRAAADAGAAAVVPAPRGPSR
jgi:hypothetical protein